MLEEKDRLRAWATPLAEAGLTSRLVARLLHDEPADSGDIDAVIKAIPTRKRWDLMHRSRYTQILTMALSSDQLAASPQTFPKLVRLERIPPTGSLGWKRFLYRNALTATVPAIVLAAAGTLLLRP